ncbi:HTH-type transcriptional regulator CitR [Collibacillus ludicampi]|jgi:LysR family transcriptional repressor of citA|uniref:HTH-type transcriptional regulator CitR n=1 Tax=Collibacillus ludicampi TaxID=2771369 RepID=A0AAV4LKZ8_9BACL|nr:LysR family transcriptional regulator [Collibacillus ludicampi]GIM48370.1 HTH-type transcriptional regulator CitR [Collibacillus ludicampi]
MDTKLLRTFVVMAKELNFHRTAERLFLAQPTVSVHIRQLEEYVGYPLFERTGRKVRLTAAGERFLIHANRILEAHDDALSDMTRWKMGFDDRLDLLISPLCAEILLPAIWKQFTSMYPNVEVRIYTTLSQSVGPGIAAGRSHLGISLVPSKHPETVTCKLYNDPVVFIAPGTVNPDRANFRELLLEHPLLTKNHPDYWEDILYQLHDLQIPIRPMTVSQVHITRKLIINGLGVSFLPLSAVEEELMNGKLVRIATPDLHLPRAATYVITPRNKELPRSAKNFLVLLNELLDRR